MRARLRQGDITTLGIDATAVAVGEAMPWLGEHAHPREVIFCTSGDEATRAPTRERAAWR